MTVHIGINGRALVKPEPTGVSRYTHNLLAALCELQIDEPRCEFLLFGVDEAPPELASYDCLSTVGSDAPHSGPRAHFWEQVQLPVRLRRYDLDLFHTPAGNPPVMTDVPQVTTIHDISPISHPEWFSRQYVSLYRASTPLAIRSSERIITVSQFAANEIVSYYPAAEGKTVPVHNGVESRDWDAGTPVASLDPREYFLFVGAVNPRKNLRRSLLAYREYRRNVDDPIQFALAGPEDDAFASTEIPDVAGVRTLGYVSEDSLTWLYRHASALIFPAIYEGFGLPILEAMSAGTPVVTSNEGAMAEVAADAALLVNPRRVDGIRRAMERLHNDENLRQKLAEDGHHRASDFTWRRAARRTLDVYEDVANPVQSEVIER